MDNFNIEKIPIDLSEVLENRRIELPTDLCMKISQHTKPPNRDLVQGDGDILLANFLDTRISLMGIINGQKNGILDTIEFIVKQKEHISLDHWDYGIETYIDISIKVELPTGQIVPIIDNKKILMSSRCMHLFFYC